MKSIRKWLEDEAGLRLSITSLTSYISQPYPPTRGGSEARC